MAFGIFVPSAMRWSISREGTATLVWPTGTAGTPTTVVCTYREAADLLREGCPFINAADKQKILAGTAIKVFNLPWKT